VDVARASPFGEYRDKPRPGAHDEVGIQLCQALGVRACDRRATGRGALRRLHDLL